MMNNIIKIAHRSGPVIYPEQTVKSALYALECGADLVEVDVRFTMDRGLAICHDDNALRVFGVDKRIDKMTDNEFSKLVHTENNEFTSHFVSDYLKANVKPILFHIKESAVLDSLIDELEKYNYSDKDVVFGIAEVESVSVIRSRWKNAKILAFMPRYEMKEDFINAGVDVIRYWEKWLGKYDVTFDFPVWIMVNSEGVGYADNENIRNLLSLDITGILVNNISVLTQTDE